MFDLPLIMLMIDHCLFLIHLDVEIKLIDRLINNLQRYSDLIWIVCLWVPANVAIKHENKKIYISKICKYEKGVNNLTF